MPILHRMTGAGNAIRILLVDDHALVLEGLESVLSKHPDFRVVASVSSGAEAIAACAAQAIDVVLLDLKMTGLDGVATCGQLRAQHPKLSIIMLTSDDRQESIRRAMEAGASGFLPKSIRSWDLAEAVRRSFRTGRLPLPTEVAARLGGSDHLPRLTERECQVLRHLAIGSSNEEIAEAIGVSTNTVKTHLKGILGKLDATTRTEAVVVALRNGLIDVD